MSDKAPELNSSNRDEYDADAALWARFAGMAGDELQPVNVDDLKAHKSNADGFALHLVDIRPPDLMRSAALMNDRWRIGHERLKLDEKQPPWTVPSPSRHFADRAYTGLIGWGICLQIRRMAATVRASSLMNGVKLLVFSTLFIGVWGRSHHVSGTG